MVETRKHFHELNCNYTIGMAVFRKTTKTSWIFLLKRRTTGKVAASIACLSFLFINIFQMATNKRAPTTLVDTHQLSSAAFPKIIWTYWNDDNTKQSVPKIVKLCSWAWQILNPDWEFRFLTPRTVQTYIPNVQEYQKAADSPARLSDFIRLAVIAQHGGVWTDASILPLVRLDHWLETTTSTTVPESTNDNSTAAVVFRLRGWSRLGPRFPLIESWFFAARPKAPLLLAWKQQFDRLLLESVDDFVQENRNHGTDFQGIDAPGYLAIHVAAQRAIQDQPDVMDNVVVHDAEDGPYRYLHSTFGWDSHKFCREGLVPGLNLTGADSIRTMEAMDIVLLSSQDKAHANNLIQYFALDKQDLLIKLRGREREPCEELLNQAK